MNLFNFLKIIHSLEEKGLHRTAEKLDSLGREIVAQVNNNINQLGDYYNRQMNNMATSYGNATPDVGLVYKYKNPQTGAIDHAFTISSADYEKLGPEQKSKYIPYITNIAQKGMTREQYYNNMVPQSGQFNHYMGMMPQQQQQFLSQNPNYLNQWNLNNQSFNGLGGKNLDYNPYNTINYWNSSSMPFTYHHMPGQPAWPTRTPFNPPHIYTPQQNLQWEKQNKRILPYSFNATQLDNTTRQRIHALGYREMYDAGTNGYIFYDKNNQPVPRISVMNSLNMAGRLFR